MPDKGDKTGLCPLMHLDFSPVISNVRPEFPKFHRKRTLPEAKV